MSTEKKTVILGVPTVKTFSSFDVMEQIGGDFNREEDCKISMLVSSASNQIHFKFFFIFKGSSKPNPIQTVRQSRFDIWNYTFSLRVKVFRHRFWETIPMFSNHPKSDYILVRTLQSPVIDCELRVN